MAYSVKFALASLMTTAAAVCVLSASLGAAEAQQSGPTQSVGKPAKKPPAASTEEPPAEQMPPPVPAQPHFVFTPWTKICSGEAGKNACGVLSEARVESGQVAVAAALVEPKESSRKLLRLTLPLGVRLEPGTRITIDQGQPTAGNYIACLASGCISDYELSSDLIDRLKKGQQLTIQAINPAGYPISISMPLADFAKAYDGPPTDEKALLESQKKLQEELERRAEEARKRLEAQPGSAGHSGSSATAASRSGN